MLQANSIMMCIIYKSQYYLKSPKLPFSNTFSRSKMDIYFLKNN